MEHESQQKAPAAGPVPAEDAVTDEDALRSRYAPPRFLAVLDELDRSCQLFIAHSPLVVIATTQPGGGTGARLGPNGLARR